MAKARKKRAGRTKGIIIVDGQKAGKIEEAKLRKRLGMPVKKGKLSRARGKYYLTVGRRKTEIPVGPIVARKEIAKLAGKDVAVVMSGRSVVAIGTWPTPERPRRPIVPCYIVCYIPAPEMIRRVDLELRQALLRAMVREKVISAKLAGEIRRGMPREL